ncbi:DUF5106 domain-containing protein [Ekhidna sp.]
MKNILQLFAVVVCLIASLNSYSQAYKIDLKIEELDGIDLFLGYYMDGSTYVSDTAKYIGEGQYTFSGTEPLDKGMYFIAKSTTLMFDLVIGDDQTFEIAASETELVSSLKVAGDIDNQLFFDNMKLNLEMRQEGEPYISVLQDDSSTELQKNEAKAKVDDINTRISDNQKEVIEKYPQSILATLFKSGNQIQIPDELKSADRKRQFEYYRAHFWDNFDLGNPVLLRLPSSLYKTKVDEYLDNLTNPIPDSAIVAVDKVIAASKNDDVTYQYLVWHLTLKYQSSKIMGMDEVYVHIVDNYFLTGEMDFWANDQLKKNLKEKADQYRNSLVGMVAPNLILQDLNEGPKALHDMKNEFTVIYFYDPDCGHCKKETPVLKAFVDTTAFDVGVYSVSADTSMVKMDNYIKEVGLENWTNTNGTRTYGLNYNDVYDAYTTPTIYVLNRKKEIIAKKIKAAQLREVLEQYQPN